MSIETYHIPVMLKECIEALAIDPNGTYVDLTMGGGGHTREILANLGEGGHLYSLDQDPDAEANAPQDERHTFVASNFRFVRGALRLRGVEQVDGILADLGVSSHHFDAIAAVPHERVRESALHLCESDPPALSSRGGQYPPAQSPQGWTTAAAHYPAPSA